MARYEKGHKDATRRHVVKTASNRFRKDGIGAVGVASLMADAGLTHGGFYAHFPSKEALVKDALVEALTDKRHELAGVAAAGGIDALIGAYMSPIHRDRPDRGCAIAAVGAEVARHPRATRLAFTAQMQALTDLIEQHLPDAWATKARRQAATSILAVMLGALQLARAAADPKYSDDALEAGRAAALALARGSGRASAS